ncbi:sensor histidine kinase [Undibacterium sp. TJN25]|uniref:sensor histidine kinase n=1 Tax=Undibacterium sp. TJN25 TaxID=3413056 RepID=UPI003BF43177
MPSAFRFSALTVSLSYVLVSLVVLVAFATPLWFSWRETVEEGRIAFLQADSQRLLNVFQRHGRETLASAIDIQVGTQPAGAEKIVLLADASFKKITGNLPYWPSEIPAKPGVYTLSINTADKPLRIAVLHTALPDGSHLLIANDVTRYRSLENLFLYGLIGAASIVVLLGTAGGLLIRRILLSKVNDISQAAFAIMNGNLTHRLPAYGGDSELNTLIETENRMLDQIEYLVDGIRNVSNSIAHDLRTPLAELRSRLEELSLTRPGPDQTFFEIEGATADVDKVIAIFNALLRLAEIDSGSRRAGFVEIDVSRIADEAVEFYLPVAELRNIRLQFLSHGPLPLAGDPLLIAQAIGNLIDNALKFVSENGSISVDAGKHSDGTLELSVSDDGPGIPDAEKEKVLERFYRRDASRGTPGAGLGLSLVAAVAKLHGGRLRLEDSQPGLKATLYFGP